VLFLPGASPSTSLDGQLFKVKTHLAFVRTDDPYALAQKTFYLVRLSLSSSLSCLSLYLFAVPGARLRLTHRPRCFLCPIQTPEIDKSVLQAGWTTGYNPDARLDDPAYLPTPFQVDAPRLGGRVRSQTSVRRNLSRPAASANAVSHPLLPPSRPTLLPLYAMRAKKKARSVEGVLRAWLSQWTVRPHTSSLSPTPPSSLLLTHPLSLLLRLGWPGLGSPRPTTLHAHSSLNPVPRLAFRLTHIRLDAISLADSSSGGQSPELPPSPPRAFVPSSTKSTSSTPSDLLSDSHRLCSILLGLLPLSWTPLRLLRLTSTSSDSLNVCDYLQPPLNPSTSSHRSTLSPPSTQADPFDFFRAINPLTPLPSDSIALRPHCPTRPSGSTSFRCYSPELP
jgi:hypothetical protein